MLFFVFCDSNVDVIYTDFAKAFDKINHQILFYIKLKQIGISGVFFYLGLSLLLKIGSKLYLTKKIGEFLYVLRWEFLKGLV